MPTATEVVQSEFLLDTLPLITDEATPLDRLAPLHAKFLYMMLGAVKDLPSGMLSLDASHPWMIFWPVNALQLLGRPLSAQDRERVGHSILACQHPDGGFGGGPGQPGHLAATYAAVMALAYTGPEFWAQVNREKLVEWILKDLKTTQGGFRVCQNGEVDPRSTYCALAATTLLGVCTPGIRRGIGEYIESCQTYEGGFANMPFGEAHGGYTFCSLASLMLLDQDSPATGVLNWCDIPRLERWLINRQDMEVPGFQGRTNKLVDGCYSHWVGGCWPLLEQVRGKRHWDRLGLRNYILKCGQSVQGGLRDKPGVKPDAYHSNYCLSGLACSEHEYTMRSMFEWAATPIDLAVEDPNDPDWVSVDASRSGVLPLHPVFGITMAAAEAVHAWTLEEPADLPQDYPPTAPAAPSTREYQGFTLYVGATVVLAVYAAWAFMPASWLHAACIDYYPSRWWAVAIPAFVLMLTLYIYVALASYNTEVLTFKADAPQTLCDNDTLVHDVSLVSVNRELYGSGRPEHKRTASRTQ